jgi:large repetitive protein
MRAMAVCTLLSVTLFVSLSAAAGEPPPERRLAINEVAWAGAAWDATVEWIELRNNSPSPVDLEGWILRSSDGAPHIQLSGTLLQANEETGDGFFLLVRAPRSSVAGVHADLVYEGALSDAGETLLLLDPLGEVVDTANAWPQEAPRRAWPAGGNQHGDSPFSTMERIDPTAPDHPSNWASAAVQPTEDDPSPVRGTPKWENSVFLVPPAVHVSLLPALPRPGEAVEFRAELIRDASSPIVQYLWGFGDGAMGDGSVITHTYAEPGTYELVLTLIDARGRETLWLQQVQVVRSSTPIADFSLLRDPDDPILRAGELLILHDESSSADAALVDWSWQFGDGTIAQGPWVQHTYAQAGVFIVALEVTNEHGFSARQTQSLTVAHRLPTADFSYAPERPVQSQSVTFDAKNSAHPEGEIAQYLWDFTGDGITNVEVLDPVTEYVFSEGGTFPVSLTVVDPWGGRATLRTDIPVHTRPTARFSVCTFSPDELQHITFSDRSSPGDAPIVSWAWSFGDGAESDERSPQHAYSGSGAMEVSLTVTDAVGATDTAVAQIEVQNLPPVARLSVDDCERPTGSQFLFDASDSLDRSPDGGVREYAWSLCENCEFALGSSSPTLSHLFSEQGTFSVRVRVTDTDGATDISDPVVITVTNRPPTISCVTWTPSRPLDGEDVSFASCASDPDGQVVEWSWSLSDVVVSTEPEPTLEFPRAGSYTLRVQVCDDHGAHSEPKDVIVNVANTPPVAQFTIQSGLDCSPRGFRFDASSSYDPSPAGEIVHVAWDFGDGTHCPGLSSPCAGADRWSPEHCYSAPGTYTVTLVVIDDQGAMTIAQETILIGE